jgi:hypothetical protein
LRFLRFARAAGLACRGVARLIPVAAADMKSSISTLVEITGMICGLHENLYVSLLFGVDSPLTNGFVCHLS